ncbi:MAG: DUF1080 domain-containing protein [Fibrobacterota bacterium]|nr:DUF1080 domain-containing protein [Fibrobacterota bacterium]
MGQHLPGSGDLCSLKEYRTIPDPKRGFTFSVIFVVATNTLSIRLDIHHGRIFVVKIPALGIRFIFQFPSTLLKALTLALPLVFSPIAQAQHLDTASGGEGYRRQGEYYGKVDGKPYGIQVVDFSSGKFDMNIFPGGLPGQGWGSNPSDYIYLKSTSSSASGTVFVGSGSAAGWTISIPPGGKTLSGTGPGNKSIDMKKIYRVSPTAGMAPPSGATVLFDGTQETYSANWTGKAPYIVGNDKYLPEGNASLKDFADHTLHIEFRTPFGPESDGQSRSNSGVYIQGNYECQVLDSFGWMRGAQESGPHGNSQGWAGGLYAWSSARINMSHPPLTWQTYDIQVTNAVFNGNNKTAPAHLTVYHNGYKVQDTIINGSTPDGGRESALGGRVFVQNHGGAMWYRNVWVLPGTKWANVPALPSLDGTVSMIRPKGNARFQKNAMTLMMGPQADVARLYNLLGSKSMKPSRAAGLYFTPVTQNGVDR